jgi:hypothetical protein
MDEENLQWEIFRVAHDIYERSGRVPGRDLDNWLEAEKIVQTLREISGDDDRKLISVNIPMSRDAGREEYSKWMINFFGR